MAQRLDSVNKGGIKDLAAIFDPTKAIQSSAYAATAAKTAEDIRRLQRTNAQGDAVMEGLRLGLPLTELQIRAGDNAELQGKLPEMWRARILNDPNTTKEQKDLAFRGAGGSYGSTEGGTHYVQGEETKRTLGAAAIGAGPGYARVAEERRQFEQKPVALFDENTGTYSWKPQGTLSGMTPGSVMPFEPSVINERSKQVPFVPPGGDPDKPMQAPSGYVNRYYPGGTVAPSPPGVIIESRKPIDLTPPGSSTARVFTQSELQKPGAQGYYSPPPKAPDTAAITQPQTHEVSSEEAMRQVQLIQQELNRRAGLPENEGYVTGRVIPPDIAAKWPQLTALVGQKIAIGQPQAQAVSEALDSVFTPGFKINTPVYGTGFLRNDTIIPGQGAAAPASPPPAVDANGRPLVQPQVKTPTQAVAGPPIPPPPTYRPAGSGPVVPNPPPAPVPPPPPAPPPPAVAQPPAPRPPAAPADALAQARSALAAGAPRDAVLKRLGELGVPVPDGF